MLCINRIQMHKHLNVRQEMTETHRWRRTILGSRVDSGLSTPGNLPLLNFITTRGNR